MWRAIFQGSRQGMLAEYAIGCHFQSSILQFEGDVNPFGSGNLYQPQWGGGWMHRHQVAMFCEELRWVGKNVLVTDRIDFALHALLERGHERLFQRGCTFVAEGNWGEVLVRCQ